MQTLNTLTFTQEEQVAIITLNRPDAANGINLTMAKELEICAKTCQEDDGIRAVLLTANGKMFSAGGDLKSFAEEGDNMATAVEQLIVHLHCAVTRLSEMNKPLVVAVNGTAAGAGFSLACIGDLVYAADNAKFTMAYSAAGLTPDAGASYFLPRLIGLRKTQELMLTNALIRAEDAQAIGVVTSVISADQLLETALNAAKQLAQGPTAAYGTIKKLLLKSQNNNLDAQLALEGRNMVNSMNTQDGKEGVSAFLEKRKPVFSGT